MPRRVFYSFHYEVDNWRANQVRQIGALDGNTPATGNQWEEVKRAGDRAIQKWIGDQMQGRSCVVVLIGPETAGRKWINYEIQHGWNRGMGIVGVHIHKLLDRSGLPSSRGANPFHGMWLEDGTPFADVARVYEPTAWNSTGTYAEIRDGIAEWIEDAIRIRSQH